jgi:hypothetical protein
VQPELSRTKADVEGRKKAILSKAQRYAVSEVTKTIYFHFKELIGK